MSVVRRGAAGLAGAAGLIAVLTLVSRVVGFGRWFVFSATVGSTCTGTAYASANLVPNVLFEVVAGGALAASVVPLLSAPLVRADRREADRIASALLTWAVLVLTPLAVVIALAAGPIGGWLTGPGCPGQAQQISRMLVVFAPQVVLYGVGVVLVGVLQAHRRFVGPALAPLLSSVVVVSAYAAYGWAGDGRQASGWVPGRGAELVLSLGTTLAVAVLSLSLLLPVHREGVRLRPLLRLPDGVAVRARRLAGAGLAGLLGQQVLVTVTLVLANRRGGDGTINVYTYVQAVYLLPYAVLALPLATAAFPQLAERAALLDPPGFAATLARSTRLVVVAGAVGAAVLAAAAPAVGQVFATVDAGQGSGQGGAALSGFTAALTAFAPGLVGLSLVAHLGRALFAAGSSRWAARAAATGWLLAAALSVVLVRWFGAAAADPRATLLALGVASTIGMTVAGALLLAGAARLRVGDVVPDGVLRGVGRTVALAAGAGLVAAVAGRLTTDALLGAGPARAVSAGVAGCLVGAAVLIGALALTARWGGGGVDDDLRDLVWHGGRRVARTGGPR